MQMIAIVHLLTVSIQWGQQPPPYSLDLNLLENLWVWLEQVCSQKNMHQLSYSVIPICHKRSHLQSLQLQVMKCVLPGQQPCGRVSALRMVGGGFNPQLSHTKNCKNSTNFPLFSHSIFGVEPWWLDQPMIPGHGPAAADCSLNGWVECIVHPLLCDTVEL